MRRVIAIFLLINILTSSLGLTYASHLCGGYLAKFQIALGTPDLDCGMMKMESKCFLKNFGNEAQLTHKNCCENHYESSNTDNTTFEKIAFKFLSIKSFAVLYHILQSLTPLKDNKITHYAHYSPPLIEHDIPVLVQSFLL